MIEHEDHCPEKGDRRCDCDYEARVRADEREKIAAAIEAAAAEWYAEPGAMSAAARIARQGGADE